MRAVSMRRKKVTMVYVGIVLGFLCFFVLFVLVYLKLDLLTHIGG